jgi:hypothetical protein
LFKPVLNQLAKVVRHLRQQRGAVRRRVAQQRNSRVSGSSASYSATLARIRARISGVRLVRKFTRSSGDMASRRRNNSTGERAGVTTFVGAELDFIGAGAFAGFPAKSGKTASCNAAQRAEHQRACRRQFIS